MSFGVTHSRSWLLSVPCICPSDLIAAPGAQGARAEEASWESRIQEHQLFGTRLFKDVEICSDSVALHTLRCQPRPLVCTHDTPKVVSPDALTLRLAVLLCEPLLSLIARRYDHIHHSLTSQCSLLLSRVELWRSIHSCTR